MMVDLICPLGVTLDGLPFLDLVGVYDGLRSLELSLSFWGTKYVRRIAFDIFYFGGAHPDADTRVLGLPLNLFGPDVIANSYEQSGYNSRQHCPLER